MPDLTVSNGRIELANTIRYFPDLVRKYQDGIEEETFDIDLLKVMRVFVLSNGVKFFRIAYRTGIISDFVSEVPEHIMQAILTTRFTIFISEDGQYDVYPKSWPDVLMAECRDISSKFLREFTPRRLIRNTKCLLPLSRNDCEMLASLLIPQIQNYDGTCITIETAVSLNFASLFDTDFYERITIVETETGMFTRTAFYTNFTEILFSYLQNV